MLICCWSWRFRFRRPDEGQLGAAARVELRVPVRRVGLGIFVSACNRTQLMAYQMGTLTSFLPAFLLSGFIYSISSMPRVIQLVALFVPARYFIEIVRGIFLKGIGLELLWFNLLLLTALCRRGLLSRNPQTPAEGGLIMRQRLRCMIRKEFIQALRDPRMRALLFMPPMIQLMIFGFAANLDVDSPASRGWIRTTLLRAGNCCPNFWAPDDSSLSAEPDQRDGDAAAARPR